MLRENVQRNSLVEAVEKVSSRPPELFVEAGLTPGVVVVVIAAPVTVFRERPRFQPRRPHGGTVAAVAVDNPVSLIGRREIAENPFAAAPEQLLRQQPRPRGMVRQNVVDMIE